MPNVNPDISSPPLSGKVEEPHHLQELVCNQAAIEGQAISSSALACTEPNSEDASSQTVLPTQHELEGVQMVEVNHDEQGSGDDARQRAHGRSKEEVIREISLSSAAFIGPPCRPRSAIDEELSEFYKELKQIDHQDTVDGKRGINEDPSQPSVPMADPAPGKASRGADLKKAHRPYSPPRSHGWHRKDYGNSRRWRPQSHNNMTWDSSYAYSFQGQWQQAPPRPLQDPQKFQFQEPQRFFPPPPSGNPVHHLYFEPKFNDYEHSESSSWGSWEETQLPVAYHLGLSSSNQPGAYEWHERNSYDWQPYEEQYYHEENRYQHNDEAFVLILMRGLPGSGKSTLAKEILSTGSTGLILSTDDYFFQENGYFFDPTVLGDAHDWNQKRAREAMLEGRSPVIIDNTNVQAWEMKPYVAMALEMGYRVEFVEPDTSWKCDPDQLERRTKHGVPRETIQKMLSLFELPMTVDIVMNSCESPHKCRGHLSKQHVQKKSDDMYTFVT
ncbi:NEDD4-binding protein 2-like 2 isoform X1 [Electrophorus electricus]|uniref:NEDD4 binding protein 2-like 2 n=1 Tax=Electrophorus electricus TaxID=8005 RepID=A0A4W4FPJ2_ELEEL|nr:NEDD4-binding protein 2-like 2 isoform X1 [Electrophorus electricus]